MGEMSGRIPPSERCYAGTRNVFIFPSIAGAMSAGSHSHSGASNPVGTAAFYSLLLLDLPIEFALDTVLLPLDIVIYSCYCIRPPLDKYFYDNDLSGMKAQLEKGADPNAVTPWFKVRRPLLLTAYYTGKEDFFRLLLDHGAKILFEIPQSYDNQKSGMIKYAFKNGCPEELLEHPKAKFVISDIILQNLEYPYKASPDDKSLVDVLTMLMDFGFPPHEWDMTKGGRPSMQTPLDVVMANEAMETEAKDRLVAAMMAHGAKSYADTNHLKSSDKHLQIDGMGIGLKMMRPEIWRTLAHPETKDPIYRWTHMFREAMGDRFYLAGTAALTSPGLEDCDATRIGGDIVHPNKPVQWDNVLMQASATLRRYYSHNIVAWNDPDTLMVDPKALTMEEARITTTVVGLPGQVMFSGDKLTQLPPERMRLIQTDLPVVDTRPMCLYPINELLPVWNLAVKTPYQTWNVVALFNWGEERQKIPVSFEELGLDADREYALYETWEEKWLGYAKDGFSVDVPPHAVRLVAVHPRSDRPILLSSDRHITRGAQDVAAVAMKGTSLAFDVRLVADHPVTVRFLLPDGWRYGGSDADCRLEAGGRILAVRLVSPRSETVSRTIPLVVR